MYNSTASLLMNEKAFLYQNQEMQTAFLSGFVYPYSRHAAKYIPYPELVSFLKKKRDTDGFFRAWYGAMMGDSAFSREDLQRRMEEWSE